MEEVRLADHDIRGLAVRGRIMRARSGRGCCRYQTPRQWVAVSGGDPGRVAHAGGADAGIAADEVGLAQHQARLAAANAAGTSRDGGVFGGARIGGGVAEAQHAIIVRRSAEPIRVGDPEHSVSECQTGGRSEQRAGRAVVTDGEIRLANDEACGLARGKSGSQES